MWFIMCILAAYYIQHILRWERGPFSIFDIMRSWMGVQIIGDDSDGYRQDVMRSGELSELITCIYCAAFWVSIVAVVLMRFVWEPLLWPFAVAGGIVLIDSIVRANYGISQ